MAESDARRSKVSSLVEAVAQAGARGPEARPEMLAGLASIRETLKEEGYVASKQNSLEHAVVLISGCQCPSSAASQCPTLMRSIARCK